MENQTKKRVPIGKMLIVIVLILILVCVAWFIHYEKSFSIPNAELSKRCEERLQIGMTKQEVIDLMGEENMQTEVVNDQMSSYVFFSYQGRQPMLWDYQVDVGFENNRVVIKDCYWGF